jgi:hypothetical protein
MKIVLTICLVLTTICLFSWSKENEINYKVIRVQSLEQSIALNPYIKSRLDSSSNVGLHQYPCPGTNAYGCQTSLSSAPSCPGQAPCPPPVSQPKNHPAPCNFGSIAFGCFSGQPIGGPGCSPLVNCQTPPD